MRRALHKILIGAAILGSAILGSRTENHTKDSPTVLMDFGDRLLAGLSRAAATTASRWAEEHRRTKSGGPWSHQSCPWALEWLDARVWRAAVLKAAQMRATESMLSKGMFCNDVLKWDVLYVLPNQHPDASGFSTGRFDSAVVASPYLLKLYDRSNVGHKRTGACNFYIRGSQSRSGLKSVPVPFLVLDELDEMNQAHVTLAYERTSGQEEKEIWELSTPTVEDHGIAKSYEESTQEHYFFECPKCSKHIELTYPDCLEVVGDDPTSVRTLRESYVKCPECKNKLEHEAKSEFLRAKRAGGSGRASGTGTWVPLIPGREKRGFYINQLYSMTVPPGEIAAAVIRSQFSEIDEQELYNSKLALPHTPRGAKLSTALIEACKGDYANGALPSTKLVTMGVDVGLFNHFEVCEWTLGEPIAGDLNVNSVPRVLYTGQVKDFEELDVIMAEYQVACCVVDAQPERRAALAFAQRHWGRIYMCFYGQGVSGKHLNVHKSDHGEPLVTVDRTSWMDQALLRFKNRTIRTPRDLPFAYANHVNVPARIWQRDKNGNPIANWVTPGTKADHHAHARTYAEIALPLACSAAQSQDMESPV